MRKLVCLLWLLSFACLGRELDWQSLDSLEGGDRQLAEQTLYEMFGDDPAQWPDWIDPAALYVPVGNDRLLIVRRPLHAPCGQYGFAMLSPVTPQLSRDKIGDFCGGEIQIVAVRGRDWPDIVLLEGRQQDEQGEWQRFDQRLRWKDGQWWRIIKPEEE